MKRPAVLAAMLIAIAALRIVSTYTVFSLTTDEPVHVSAGLELLQQHTYKLLPVNPPLARIFFAIPPTLGGMKWSDSADYYQTSRDVFYGGEHYLRKLVLARVGNLPFFIIAAIALFLWTRLELGAIAAVLATFLFTFQPIVLGYSGIANHDTPGTAGVAIALYAFAKWLRQPDAKRAAWLGVAYGFSILCKLSSIPFVPAACGLMFIAHVVRDPRLRNARVLATIALVPLLAAVVIWGGYGFTIGHIAGNPEARVVPAPSFFEGIEQLMDFDKGGFVSYAFGRTSTKGWWWYFPVAIGLKTTLPFLALFFIGGWFALRSREMRWFYVHGALAALGILIVSLFTTLDLGVRYVLPIYVPLSFATAAGLVVMLRDARLDVRRIAIALAALHGIVSLAAHPDYFPYFNALARDPAYCLVDSNLDWGQDALRLKKEVRKLKIEAIGLLLPGNIDADALGFPPSYQADAFRPQRGWIAIGEHFYRIDRLNKGWWWLEPYRVRHVGKSIRLYFVPDASWTSRNTRFFEPGKNEEILLPIGGTARPWGPPGGAKWEVAQTVYNKSDKPVQMALSQCARPPCTMNLAARSSAAIAGSDPITPIWATVPSDRESDLEFSTIVRRADRVVAESTSQVPAVRASDFGEGDVVIDNVPFSPDTRLNLRLYSLVGGSMSYATVRVSDGANVLAEAKVPLYSTRFYTHGDFGKVVPSVRAVNATVSIHADRRIWAFFTATEPSGRTSVFLPRDVNAVR